MYLDNDLFLKCRRYDDGSYPSIIQSMTITYREVILNSGSSLDLLDTRLQLKCRFEEDAIF